jgi:hypothetical protein
LSLAQADAAAESSNPRIVLAGLPAVVTKGHFSVDKNLLDLEKSL